VSDTAKTILIVGGAAVGVFVVLKLVAPSPAQQFAVAPKSNTDLITLGGLVGLGKGIFDSFKSTPVVNEGTYRVDTEFNVVGNTLTDDKGKVLVYGTD